jgi:rfaE bifunctional protein nucleotidyltransferase chain/domain
MSSKIIGRSRLSRILNRVRGGKIIVFTNGCFDLLHPGHVRLLQKAKSLGDLLVVAINSDRSLKKLKGGNRPFVDEKSRAEILSALDSVDYVTVFSEPTPLETIRALKPDILVKGADYKRSEIVGRNHVKKVVRIPLVKNFSTSALIRKIVHAYGK